MCAPIAVPLQSEQTAWNIKPDYTRTAYPEKPEQSMGNKIKNKSLCRLYIRSKNKKLWEHAENPIQE